MAFIFAGRDDFPTPPGTVHPGQRFACAATQTPAQATEVTFTNDFEDGTWGSWQGLHEGDGVAGKDLNQGLAHTGKNNGWLCAGNGWAAQRLAIHVGFMPRSVCSVGIYMQPVGGGAQVGLQLWDPDGWRLIAKTYPYLDGSGYQFVELRGLDLRANGIVYLQAIYGNNHIPAKFVRIDDAVVHCHD
jgi:hypothetical protein